MDDKLEADELSLELDIDEAEHLHSIHEKYIDLLRLANEGAVLSGEISAEPDIGSTGRGNFCSETLLKSKYRLPNG